MKRGCERGQTRQASGGHHVVKSSPLERLSIPQNILISLRRIVDTYLCVFVNQCLQGPDSDWITEIPLCHLQVNREGTEEY